MTNQTQLQPRIERIEKIWTPDAKLYIPHEDNEVVFAYPSFGPNTYLNNGEQILDHNLAIATGDQIASLLHAAYYSDFHDEPEFEDIRNIMKDRWISVFNRNLWTNKGVYIVQDTEAKCRTEELELSNLEKRLSRGTELSNGLRVSEDGTVRFAPKGSYELGYNSREGLTDNGFVIASYGEAGAKKLAEISLTNHFENKPYVYGLDLKDGQNPVQRVSALGDYGGYRLYIDGNDFNDGRESHAFGVLN
jgi:hypothetical protein